MIFSACPACFLVRFLNTTLFSKLEIEKQFLMGDSAGRTVAMHAVKSGCESVVISLIAILEARLDQTVSCCTLTDLVLFMFHAKQF